MWKRILVAMDLSPVSRPALETAARIARESGATLFALTVDDLPEGARAWLEPLCEPELVELRGAIDRHAQWITERLSRELAAMRPQIGNIAVEPIFRWGRPAETIVGEAERLDADVIVVGSTGKPFGSVSERVAKTASRPVLVVPAVQLTRAPAEPRRESRFDRAA